MAGGWNVSIWFESEQNIKWECFEISNLILRKAIREIWNCDVLHVSPSIFVLSGKLNV